MTALELIVFGLATWRISSLLVNESGPFFVFENLRIKVGIQYLTRADGGETMIVPDKFLCQLLSCIWCVSPYVGSLWMTFFLNFPPIAFYVAVPFSLSAGAIFLNLLVEKLKS